MPKYCMNKNLKTKGKKVTVLSLSALMALGAFPIQSFAAEDTPGIRETKEKEIVEIMENVDKALKVSNKINSLPSYRDMTLENEKEIKEIRAEYEALSEEEKDKVINYRVLEDAEAKMETLRDKENKKEEEKKENEKNKEEYEKILKDYVKDVKFINGIENGRVSLDIPEIKDYEVNITVRDKDGTTIGSLAKNKVAGVLKVAYMGDKEKYTVYVDLISDGKVVAEESIILVSPEASAPSLKYAYTYDGGLVINIKADAGIEDVYWAYKGDKDFTRIADDGGFGKKYKSKDKAKKEHKNEKDFSDLFKNYDLDRYTRLDPNDFRIECKIPSTIEIVAIDKAGNHTPLVVKVEKNNKAITSNIPKTVVKALKDTTTFKFDNNEDYKDLIVIEKDTMIDLFETFEEHIVDELEDFNTRDLSYTCKDLDDIPYTGVYKFDKVGVFEIKVKDKESKKSVLLTVVVNKDENNVRDYELKDKEIKVKSDKFKPIDALKLDLYDSKEKPNPIQFVAIVNDKYYKLTDEIEFKDKDGKEVKEINVKIVNLKDDKDYKVKFIKEKEEVKVTNFTDIAGHWAEHIIKGLAQKGVINGYEDGQFKPEHMITIRETLAILGRYAERNEELVAKETSSLELLAEKDDKGKENWGYKEIAFATKRLPVNIFAGKDIDKEAITREEVAYVMNHVYGIQGNGVNLDFVDIDESSYVTEVENMTKAGVIKGYPDNTFKPDLQITRAELSSLLYNLPSQFK